MRRRQRRSRLFLPATFAVAGLLLISGWTLTAAFAESASPAPGASGGLPGDPTKGAQIFGQNCASCHGSNLEGGIGPKLNPIQHLGNISNPLDPTYLVNTISNGLQGVGGYTTTAMPPWKSTLSPQDINDVAAFIIQSNQSGPAGLTPQALAQSDVFWVSIAIFLMVMVTVGLSRYNMRWIDRRAAARRERERTG
jgi:mono/diheme cytochrome c family protein